MGKEIPLGKLLGIKVSMDLTVPLLAAFLVYFYATDPNGFQAAAPDVSGTAYWLAGGAMALLFFVSLLVHELGHALVAQDEGIGVRGISLWLLGGVAKLESSATTPRTEFRIAVVGPVASAACGVAFLVTAYAIPDTMGLAGLVGYVALVLGFINLLLAVFNLLPASPLDGGTVLSAMIWKRTGRQATGMRWAGYSGVAMGGAMMLYAIKPVFGLWTFQPLLLILVGGFITFAAVRSLQALPMYDLLEGLTVADAMSPSPPPAPGWSSVADFVSTLPAGNEHQAYPVFGHHGRLEGLLTVTAIRAAPQEQWRHLRVTDLAYPVERVTVVGDREPLLPAVQRVDGGDVRDGLVTTADGTVVGTVSARALFTALERRKVETAEGVH